MELLISRSQVRVLPGGRRLRRSEARLLLLPIHRDGGDEPVGIAGVRQLAGSNDLTRRTTRVPCSIAGLEEILGVHRAGWTLGSGELIQASAHVAFVDDAHADTSRGGDATSRGGPPDHAGRVRRSDGPAAATGMLGPRGVLTRVTAVFRADLHAASTWSVSRARCGTRSTNTWVPYPRPRVSTGGAGCATQGPSMTKSRSTRVFPSLLRWAATPGQGNS